jgi:FkbH-like protein
MIATPSTLQVVVAASFTAQPVVDILSHWLRELDFGATLTLAPYNQIAQHLLDPASVLSHDANGINVLLVQPVIDAPMRAVESVDQLVALIAARASASEARWIVAACPPAPPVTPDTPDAQAWELWEQRLAAGLAAVPGTHVLRAADVLRPYRIEAYYDQYAHRLADLPYTHPFLVALGTRIARVVHGLVTPPRKVIALDCDNTLWRGTCGEDALDDLEIDPPRTYLQEFCLDRMRAGALLCLCSRNEADDVWHVFDAHPGMRLRRDHLVAWWFGWGDKSSGLRTLAEELQLDLDTFIFLDDDPVVCAEVRARLPQVVTLQVPADGDRLPSLLDHVWAFDLPSPTAADRARTEQYQLRRDREQWRTRATTPDEFERALDVRVDIRDAADPDLARIAQLTTRTTQFNCTLRRQSESELRQRLGRAEHAVLAVSASDRYGDYGLVGAIAGHACGEIFIVDILLLSCRALGRNIERHMIDEVARLATARGHAIARLPFVPGARNAVARAFLDRCAPHWRPEPGGADAPVYACELRSLPSLPDTGVRL